MENIEFGVGTRLNHPEYGFGVVIQVKSGTYLITFKDHGTREIGKQYDGFEVIDLLEQADDLMSYEQLEQSLIKILREYSDLQEVVPIADKWRGGKIVLHPGSSELKTYEMPINTFFKKIVMVRDRIRVLEQKVNSSNINEDEKIAIQQYITRSYGSLTSFNILFKNKSDQFVGESGKSS
ncbi:MAG: hypothetical protein C0596_05560 [Marinilabiliales bacterium]|nr:MAG: hypothetical protein C0596_05560 [Marinilabiliales bacterium]